jgi:mannose-6-phosphate isomerase-like protein (cupin superfamily)
MRFATRTLADTADAIAPDGSQVRLLASIGRGSMAHFTLAPGEVSRAAVHRTVEELWLFLAGEGRMWRRDADGEAVVPVRAGVSISIPTGTAFQFRADGDSPLQAVGVTMPPWPGDSEAEVIAGAWAPRLG